MLSAASRERQLLLVGLALILVLSWAYLIDMALDMSAMSMQDMVMPMAWTPHALLMLFVMWAIMMVAMMLPSAAPMILTFLSVNQRRAGAGRRVVPTYVFVLGYVVVWTGYSLAATVLQWFLHERLLMNQAMATQGPYLSGAILVVAGLFQWTPLKNACLQHCRSPLTFLMSEWREGARGAFAMGLRHGSYCVGCCWALMLVLFVAGVMNLLAVALLAVFVLVEKVIPRGQLFARLSGLVLIVSGLGVMVATH